MDPTDRDAPHVWLSYPEAAAALGISVRAVEGRAYRGEWRKQRANDGAIRLAVPREALDPARRGADVLTDGATRVASHGAHGSTESNTISNTIQVLLDELKASHERHAADLRQQVADQRKRAEAAEGREQGLTQALGRVEREAMAQRERAARAEAERDRAQGELESWTAGSPLARAWRAFLNRRGRP